MTKAQKLVAIGSASGGLFMLAALWSLTQILPGLRASANVAERLAFAAQWNAIAIIPLVLVIISVGNQRFAGPAIDPIAEEPGRTIVIDNRVIDNTLQQYVLFAAATFAVSAGASGDQVSIISAAAMMFIVLRLAFWIGYRIDPLYRAFGMGGTLYLNLVLLGYAIWLA